MRDTRTIDRDGAATRDRARGALLGLAAGDAVGTTVEFERRGDFEPLTDMVGGGPFGLEPGQWTDDTSMALCLAESLVERDGFDAADQMRRYLRWRDEGHLSSTGTCFDIGATVRAALERFETGGEPFAGSTAPDTAGNGSLMRLAPALLHGWPEPDRMRRLARESSRTTHGAAECLDTCELMAELVHRALSGATKAEILRPVSLAAPTDAVRAIADMTFVDKGMDEIRGSGYAVESLEAALWCFAGNDTFESAILAAANLGDDADTTAAICGQLAGAHHGLSGIPAPWIERLAMRERMLELADALVR